MIYVVRCEHNCFYVGRTERGIFRILEHLAEQGSEWTRVHKPIEVVEQLEGDGFVEDAVTKRYMATYGIESVRGGSYCTMHLLPQVKMVLIREMRGSLDCCFNCGLVGHFVQDCPTKAPVLKAPVPKAPTKTKPVKTTAPKKPCARCGRLGHSRKTCYATTHFDGRALPALCKRCGRNHAGKCNAITDVNGNAIK
jgi:hypothetical protein